MNIYGEFGVAIVWVNPQIYRTFMGKNQYLRCKRYLSLIELLSKHVSLINGISSTSWCESTYVKIYRTTSSLDLQKFGGWRNKKNTLPKWWFDWFDGEENPMGSNPQQNHQLNKQKYTTTSQPNWRTKPSQLKAVAHHFSKRWGAIATARSKHWELLLRCMAPWKSNGSTLLEGICTIPYNVLSHPYRRKEKN